MKKILVKYKPRKQMHDYQGLHSGVPFVRLHVPKNEIWIQKEIHDRNPARARRIMLHELRESKLMSEGYSYKTAHRKAKY